jgi:superfamily II DNA or RNA helicase
MIWNRLMPHQKEVVAAVTERKKVSDSGPLVLHMSFGTGKTVTSLFAALYLLRSDEVVYLAPPQLLPQVRREITKFGFPHERVRLCSTLSADRVASTSVLIVDEYHWWTKRNKLFPVGSRVGWKKVLLMSGSPPSTTGNEYRKFIGTFSEGGLDGEYLEFMHVAKKVLHQPELTVRYVQMTPEQREAYQRMVEKAGSYRQLQQDRSVLSMWKVPIVVSALSTEFATSKCVVFSEFTTVLLQLWRELLTTGVQMFRVFLGSPAQRQKQVEAFRVWRGGPAVALCSSGVASHGLNLGEAEVLLLVESPYSRRTMLQIIGRLTRIGQKRGQSAVFWVFVRSFEAHLLRGNCEQFARVATT